MARMVGKDEVELILTDDIIGRIMVQTSRQSGLSIVLTELLDFNGDEIYFKHENSLIGKLLEKLFLIMKIHWSLAYNIKMNRLK